jgi:hypothetical protein
MDIQVATIKANADVEKVRLEREQMDREDYYESRRLEREERKNAMEMERGEIEHRRSIELGEHQHKMKMTEKPANGAAH